MSKYATLVHVDNAEYVEVTPRLRLRKYGSWLIKEKKQQDRIAKDRSRQLLGIVQLAKKISMEKGISVDDAFLLINSADSGDNATITADYITEVKEIIESTVTQTESDAQILTMFLRSRAEGLIDDQWQKLDDWEGGDTDELDEAKRQVIVEFINNEQAGGVSTADDEGEEDSEAGTEGNEKKNSASGKDLKSTASESSATKTTGKVAMQESPLAA